MTATIILTTTPDQHTAYIRGFSVSMALGCLLLGSWLCPITRVWWDTVDQAVFFALNGSVAAPSAWSQLWALMNVRIMDLVPLLFLLPFMLIPDLIINRHQRMQAGMQLLMILIVMLVVRTVLDQVTEILAWRGKSPSLTLQPAHLLSSMYPGLPLKDSSSHSFPGDHSGVLMIVASFLLLKSCNRWSVLAACVASLFIAPRLIAGAHWLSDVLVGGVFIASISMAFGFFMPWPRQWADELAKRILHHPLTPSWMR